MRAMTRRQLIFLISAVATTLLSLSAVSVGACGHHHPPSNPDDASAQAVSGGVALPGEVLSGLRSGGCDGTTHHNHHGHGERNFPPRHPGDTDHAIVHYEPGSEVYYPEDDDEESYENGANGTLSEVDGRGLRRRRHRRALRRCGVPDPTSDELVTSLKVLDDWERRHPGRKQALHRMLAGNVTAAADAGPNRTVIIWWHVLKAGNTPILGKWTRAQVVTAVNLAARYLANTPFKFVLGGITQTTNRQWFNCPYEKSYATELAYKTALRREGANTLNVYMCDLRRGQGLWGFTYTPTILMGYPEYDGIVLSNPFTKPDGHTALDAQMTFIHELGHWLGLYHTWTGTCDALSGGDSVFDTPAHVGYTWSYKGWQTCFAGKKYNTCPDNKAGVDPGLDPVLNHMNYVDTKCEYQYGTFTPGQMTTMVSKFDTYRFNKTTCRKTGVPCLINAHCCSNNCINGTTKLCA